MEARLNADIARLEQHAGSKAIDGEKKLPEEAEEHREMGTTEEVICIKKEMIDIKKEMGDFKKEMKEKEFVEKDEFYTTLDYIDRERKNRLESEQTMILNYLPRQLRDLESKMMKQVEEKCLALQVELEKEKKLREEAEGRIARNIQES